MNDQKVLVEISIYRPSEKKSKFDTMAIFMKLADGYDFMITMDNLEFRKNMFGNGRGVKANIRCVRESSELLGDQGFCEYKNKREYKKAVDKVMNMMNMLKEEL